MNKINKSAIIKGREQSFNNETIFENYALLYPIKEVKSCSYSVKASRQDGFILLLFKVDAQLVVFDSRDNVQFPYHAKFDESVEIFEDENDFESGYYLPGPSVDLDEVALGLIHSSLPLRLVRKGDPKMSKSVDQINFKSENEVKEERSNFSLEGLPEFPDK